MRQQNIILTSIVALVIATPSMATPTVGQLVTTGASCTIGDLGVSSGTANATAQFSVNSYNCAAGTYLPAGSSWSTDNQYTPYSDGDDPIQCMQCPANSVCSGSEDSEDATDGVFEYSQSSAQGITTCSSETDGAYPYSDAGTNYAWGNEDDEGLLGCYNNVTCPTVSAATACDPHAATCAYTNNAVTSGRQYANGQSNLQCTLDFTCATGYTKSTTQTVPTLPSTSTNGNSREYHSHDNNNVSTNGSSLSAGEWNVSWTSGATQGTMKGIASCNSIAGRNDDWTWANPSTLPANSNLASTSTTGRYCWCKPTSWTPSGGTTTELSAAWVFYNDLVGASNCAGNCANLCAFNVGDDAGFRSALFGVVGASAQCVANTIDINWKNENGTVFTTDQCTYDESLTVPSTHPDKRGYTFTGWKFVSPSQN